MRDDHCFEMHLNLTMDFAGNLMLEILRQSSGNDLCCSFRNSNSLYISLFQVSAPRGFRGKKQKKKAVYRGGLVIEKDPKGKGKAVIEDDSSSSEPQELPSLSSDLKNPDWTKEKDLPKCPTPFRMFNWSNKDYELYDEFLIAKFNVLGFSNREKTYVRMRDPNSRVARLARAICKKWGKQF